MTDCQSTLSFLDIYDFVATKVEIYNYDSQSYDVLDLSEGCDIDMNVDNTVLDKNDLDELNLMLYVKEKFGVSNQAYHEMSIACKSLPRSWKLKDRVKEMNNKWNIRLTPSGNGVQQSISDRLLVELKALIVKSIPVPTTLKVKLTGDGTFIGKHIHVVNIAFTLLNEGDHAMAADGNHTVAVLKVKEDYKNLKEELQDIINEVEHLKFVDFNGIKYDIDWYLGGDWKFLAMVCGIGNAISEFPCIWCKCQSCDKFDVTKEWSMTDPSKGARTTEEITRLSSKKG